MNISGSCHCGSIAFEANVDANKIMICHCNDCQKLSGTAFRTVVISQVDGFHVTKGEVKEYIKTAESGNKRAQGFCQHCGSGLYATSETKENRVYGIRVGVVDQRNELKPGNQIWCNSAMSWLSELNDIPKFATMPNA